MIFLARDGTTKQENRGSPLRHVSWAVFSQSLICSNKYLSNLVANWPNAYRINDALAVMPPITAAVSRFGATTVLVATSAGVHSLTQATALPFLFFVPAVMLAGFFLGAWPGIYAAQLSTALTLVFFLPHEDPLIRSVSVTFSAFLFDAIAVMSSASGASVVQATRAATALKIRVAEEAQKRLLAEDAFRQSQKMEAVGQMTGGLAHDFNNILTGINCSLDLIDVHVQRGRSDCLQPYIATARISIGRASALTHRLLAFSRRQALDPKIIDAGFLIAGTREMLTHLLGPSIKLAVAPAADLWPMRVDASQLENALLNLCINARDAMPEGGAIIITAINLSLDLAAARDREVAPGDYVALQVCDDGIGMSAETAAHVFEPFFTTKPVGQGTGLGLSMVYDFAKQSGGSATIYSKQMAGTCICLLLPRCDEVSSPSEVVSQLPGARAEVTAPIELPLS